MKKLPEPPFQEKGLGPSCLPPPPPRPPSPPHRREACAPASSGLPSPGWRRAGRLRSQPAIRLGEDAGLRTGCPRCVLTGPPGVAGGSAGDEWGPRQGRREPVGRTAEAEAEKRKGGEQGRRRGERRTREGRRTAGPGALHGACAERGTLPHSWILSFILLVPRAGVTDPS